jgi:hypothetical protein
MELKQIVSLSPQVVCTPVASTPLYLLDLDGDALPDVARASRIARST